MESSHEAVDVGTLLQRVEELIDQGRPGAARPLLAAVRGLMPPSSGLSALAARLALCEGSMNTTAAADLDLAVEADPRHGGLRRCRAELRRRSGDLNGAARDASEAVILDRDDPAAKALLGELLLLMGRAEHAAACLAEALVMMPRNIICRELLAQAETANGNMDGALATLQEGIALLPGAAALRNAAILLCIRRRDFTQAEQLAEHARIDGAADASTYGLKGHALSSLGRQDDASLAYNEALKLAPGDAHIRHLATAPRSPEDFVRAMFDRDAENFEAHIIELGYRIPALIRHHVIAFAAIANTGPVLDLGCGTGLVALALSDLDLGPFTGIDISPRMLDKAREKGLYASLREARLPEALRDETAQWRLILAGDVLCYFGPLDDMFAAVRDRLRPGGRFIFSVEELLPDHDGIVPGNGDWAPGRRGRHAHAAHYLLATAEAIGLRCLSMQLETLRHEAGGPVAGLLTVLERPRQDA